MYAGVALTIVAIIITRSRGGFLTLIAVLFLLVMKSRHKFEGLSVGAALAILFLVFLPSDIRERLATLKNPQEEGSASGRLHAWGVALNMAEKNPLLGVGFQSFIYHFRDYDETPIEEWEFGKSVKSVRVAHNSYLQTPGGEWLPFVVLLPGDDRQHHADDAPIAPGFAQS